MQSAKCSQQDGRMMLLWLHRAQPMSIITLSIPSIMQIYQSMTPPFDNRRLLSREIKLTDGKNLKLFSTLRQVYSLFILSPIILAGFFRAALGRYSQMKA